MEQAKNYTIKTFKESCKTEEEACKFVIPYFVNLYWEWFEDVRNVEDYWKEDIDFFINWTSVEMKASGKILRDFLFELKREEQGVTKQGNLLTSQAEYWLIVNNEKKLGWLFKLKELKTTVLKIIKQKDLEKKIWHLYRNQDNWNERYSRTIWIDMNYLIQNIEYCKRIDFENTFNS